MAPSIGFSVMGSPGEAVLQLLQAPGPILAQQPGHAAVREEPPVGLAGGAIVGLVVGIADPLNRSAAHGTRLAEASMHGHALPKCGHGLRKAGSRLHPKSLSPLSQYILGRSVKASDRRVVQ